jgi:hypothetical protein
MSFNDVLKKAFPFISAAASLGGPVGTIAATLVGKAIGIDKVEPTTEGISTAIATGFADPAQRAALIQAEQNFQAQMAELGYRDAEALAATAASDRANARQREMSIKDKIPAILSIAITCGFFGVLGYMLLRPIPPTGHDAMLLMLGSLSTAWAAVVGYYFGSSAGSAQKTDLLAQAPPIQK